MVEIPQNPETRESQVIYKIEETKAPEDLQKYFEWYCSLYPEQKIEDNIQSALKSDQHLFIVRNPENHEEIIAGAKIAIYKNESENSTEAFFSKKLVSKNFQQQNIGKLLVDARIEIARAENCTHAYAALRKGNSKAARSLLKDGFYLEQMKADKIKEPVDDVGNYFLAEISLQPENTQKEIINENLLINFEDTQAIDAALENGFRGIKLLLPKDRSDIKVPTLLLEKPL